MVACTRARIALAAALGMDGAVVFATAAAATDGVDEDFARDRFVPELALPFEALTVLILLAEAAAIGAATGVALLLLAADIVTAAVVDVVDRAFFTVDDTAAATADALVVFAAAPLEAPASPAAGTCVAATSVGCDAGGMTLGGGTCTITGLLAKNSSLE